jgi:type II secretory pathway pseudopilin PulG
MFLLALLVLWLSVAVPRMSKEIQRDREVETMNRGKQYIRGIRMYYRKFHAYPPNVDALVKTNEIRFLRKKYIDPMTGKDDWKPIMFGQNKAPTVMGFFGQPLSTGSSLAGIGASGGNGVNGAQNPGGMFNSGSNGSFGGSSGTLGSIFNSQQSSTIAPTSSSGTDTTGGTDSTGGNIQGGTGGASSGGGTSTSTDANGNPTSGSGTGTGLSGQSNGQSFGGGGIIGFSPASPKPSILIYKKKQHYNEWEFVYDPIMEQMFSGGGNTGMIGTPAANGSTPIGNSGFGGSSIGGPGIGSPGLGSPGLGSGSSGSDGNGIVSSPNTPQPQ